MSGQARYRLCGQGSLSLPEPACAIAGELISTANGLGSARVATQVTDLRTSLAPWRRNPDVTDLLHRLESFKAPLVRP